MNSDPIRPGDFVAPKGQRFPKGIVQEPAADVPRNERVVKWPDGGYTKQPVKELRRVA